LKILIVDDDPQIRDVLTIALERAGYTVIAANNGQAALMRAQRDTPDLIVLDIGLPELDGLEVCRRIRNTSQMPILFLTAHDDEIDRILGLELGADDYVTKPFSPRELVARIKAILKRVRQVAKTVALQHGALELDLTRHACRLAEAAVPLTATEMALLHRLLLHPAHVVTRAQLIDAVYGSNVHVSERTLDSHIRNLRRKLALAGCSNAVETVHGVGLRMGTCQMA
jgi:two-component system, OmpR family, response regulator